METQERVEEGEENDNNSKVNHTVGEPKKFNIELTVSQANAMTKLLPHSYSFVVEREIKFKRTANKKKQHVSKKEISSHIDEVEEPSERVKKPPAAHRYNEELAGLNNYSRASSQAYYDEIDDNMKPCLRILHMLKNHKTSWPFREPVDVVGLGIPNYF